MGNMATMTLASRSDYSCVEIAFKITTLNEGSSSNLMLSQLEWTVLIHFIIVMQYQCYAYWRQKLNMTLLIDTILHH